MNETRQFGSAEEEVKKKAFLARKAALEAAVLSSETRIQVVNAMADALLGNTEAILNANRRDMENAKAKNIGAPLLDRLLLTRDRIRGMAKGLQEVAKMPDHLGDIYNMRQRLNGLLVGKMRVPIGVIGIIYEARPNVTSDAAGLCVKAGNVVLLRGGSLAINSNIKITEIISQAGESKGLPKNSIQSITTTDRKAVVTMLQLRGLIDVVIPRGSAKFIQEVVANAKVPVIETGAGNCHTYIDKYADLDMALEIVYNGKVQRPSVCNATKKVLVHANIARDLLPKIKQKLGEAGVVFLTDKKAQEYFPGSVIMKDNEWDEEFLDMRLGVKIVESIDEAIAHINKHGSRHTEAIVSAEYKRALKFIKAVDAASILWNASTRFTDGGEFGLGAEIGIST
ncbi:MAG: glutamate-5-semialdehyde dehydrogenase, partial [Candidatus Ranarchaeia archaeon]